MILSVPSFTGTTSGLPLNEVLINERTFILHEIDYDEWLLLNHGTTLPKSAFPWPLTNKIIRLMSDRVTDGHSRTSLCAMEALLETQDPYLQMTPIDEILSWEVHDLFERYVCDLGVYSYLGFKSAEDVNLEIVAYAHRQLVEILTSMHRSLKQIEQVPCLSSQRLRQELIQSYLFSGLPCAH